jgi:hypothetical protein
MMAAVQRRISPHCRRCPRINEVPVREILGWVLQPRPRHGGSRPDSLIRRVAPLSKNGPLLTNLRVVLVSGVHLNTAPHIGPWKGPHTASFRKIGMVLAMRRQPGIPGCLAPGSFANYGVSATWIVLAAVAWVRGLLCGAAGPDEPGSGRVKVIWPLITPVVPANITISSKSDAIQIGRRSAGYRTGIITCS